MMAHVCPPTQSKCDLFNLRIHTASEANVFICVCATTDDTNDGKEMGKKGWSGATIQANHQQPKFETQH